jgi:hypothetical protein
MTTTERPTIRDIPRHFEGGHSSPAERRFEMLFEVVKEHAKGNPALQYVLNRLSDAASDRVGEAADFGQAVGPGIHLGVDEWTDEEYEERIGKKRPVPLT